MMKKVSKSGGRLPERIGILVIAVVLSIAFLRLYDVLAARMKDVDAGLKAGTIVNLNSGDRSKAMSQMLSRGYYFEDPKDVAIIERSLATSNEEFTNIGELNKKQYNVSADEASVNGGESFKKRVAASRAMLSFTGEDEQRFGQEVNAPPALPSEVQTGSGDGEINGRINLKGDASAGVLLRLKSVFPQDSTEAKSITAYARTGSDGRYAFKGLPEDQSYELIALKPGFEFGQVKGVETLNGSKTLNFTQNIHTLRLLSTRDFNNLKAEGALVVRSPEDFTFRYWLTAGIVIGIFIVLHILLSLKFPEADQYVLPLLMVLTGFSFLTLLSLQDPVRDRFLTGNSSWFLIAGAVLLSILLFCQIRKFNPDSRLYRLFVFEKDNRAANGWPWIMLAIGVLMLTLIFGAGPEGSGVKVNLLGVQPSELVKYLVVLFLAGFFAVNEQFIAGYFNWKKRWSFFSFALAAIGFTLLLFLMLGDLGPAIVICFTFIVLFSFSRGDFSEMAAFVILYVLIAWLVDNVWLVVLITSAAVALYYFLKKKTISESTVMALLVITAFLTIDKIPYLDKLIPGPVQRLSDRKSIWQDAWDNEVFGGDQVANGLWAISTGGITGQGNGKGFAKAIPEAHTDMILPAIGEEFGWLGIGLIFCVFFLYLQRSLVIARKTGTPFLFYLCAGIGICTFIQFLLIAGGSIGALPLSGVSLPFESYGGSSLLMNFIAAGFLLSSSSLQGTERQMKYLTGLQDKNLVPTLVAASAGVILLLVNVSRYSLNSKSWVVKPALVADRAGSRMFSYNPRIGILMKRLEAGNIYDRKGLLLATSDPSLVNKQRQQLDEAGVGSYDLDSAKHRRMARYYPFEEQLFFWTGDANTGVFNGSINGYFAEYEHAAELRGFRMPLSNYTLTASRYREDKFLPRRQREMTVVKRDFSELSALLVSGLDSAKIAAFKNQNRNVKLSVDASLQTKLQNALRTDEKLAKSRVSVVVMSAENGDVLASAAYPLAPVKNWEQLTMSTADQNRLTSFMTTADPGFTIATQPGSTAKLVTALAAFNKLGPEAARLSYTVRANERIRTGGPEPDETGNINMERAIVKSNNVYFIKLANEQQLQLPMAELYLRTGMFLHGVGGYYYNKRDVDPKREQRWFDLWERTEFKAPYDPKQIYRNRAAGISGMAWGQGELISTPASVARLAAGIANGGKLVPNRFALSLRDSVNRTAEPVVIAKDPSLTKLLRQYMIEQSAGKAGFFGLSVAGKTGTPERMLKGKKINDGWYVFFAPDAAGSGNTVVCIRIENTKGSSEAIRVAGDIVIPALVAKGYLKSII